MSAIDIYTIRYCPYCYDAKELLSRKGVSFQEIDASGNKDVRKEMIQRANGCSTYPQIFIGTTHVGGCDDLYALDESGKLDPLLAETQEKSQEKSKDPPA
jgi:glutaredoxin 3